MVFFIEDTSTARKHTRGIYREFFSSCPLATAWSAYERETNRTKIVAASRELGRSCLKLVSLAAMECRQLFLMPGGKSDSWK